MNTADRPSIRVAFVERFGEPTAQAIESAAEEHNNEVHSNRGSDPFKWALLICIGYECMSKEKYRKHHGIAADWADLKAWIKDKADLSTHVGDCDYLALFAGIYNEFVPQVQP